jgi:hypothetical protein
MEEIVEGDQEKRTLIVRSLGPAEDLLRTVLELPGVGKAIVDDDLVRVEFTGSEEGASDLLLELVRRGFRIAEFHQERVNLEQVFMNVTTGGVQ